MRRDSNPQGCGAEETRSVFQRSTQGAERRSGARPPAGGCGIPPSHINNGLSVSQPALGDVPKVPALKERHQVPAHPPSKDRRPKPERTKSALHLENISPVPKSEPSSTKWRVAPAGRALSLSRVPHAKKATNLDVLDVTARGALVWQGDVKQGGADLLVAPPKLNVRLPCQGPSQRQEDRRSVELRN